MILPQMSIPTAGGTTSPTGGKTADSGNAFEALIASMLPAENEPAPLPVPPGLGSSADAESLNGDPVGAVEESSFTTGQRPEAFIPPPPDPAPVVPVAAQTPATEIRTPGIVQPESADGELPSGQAAAHSGAPRHEAALAGDSDDALVALPSTVAGKDAPGPAAADPSRIHLPDSATVRPTADGQPIAGNTVSDAQVPDAEVVNQTVVNESVVDETEVLIQKETTETPVPGEESMRQENPGTPIPQDSIQAESRGAQIAGTPVASLDSAADGQTPANLRGIDAVAGNKAHPSENAVVRGPHVLPLNRQLSGPIASLATGPHGERTLSVNIAPETLGPITVKAYLGNEGLRVELTAPTEAGREALRAILPELRRDLAATGAGTLTLGNSTEAGSGGGQPGAASDQRFGAATSAYPVRGRQQADLPDEPLGTGPMATANSTHLDVMA